VLVNLLAAAPLVLAARGFPEGGGAAGRRLRGLRARLRAAAAALPGAIPDAADAKPGAAAPPPRRAARPWRAYVRSAVVERAWETLCGSIIQEFVYDAWYASLSPDREFPAEVRRALDHAFGQLAGRARRVDLRAALQDACELAMEQVELYRDTRDAVATERGGGAPPPPGAAREAALAARLAADGNLHPALAAPDGAYRMLRAVAGGLAECLLDPADAASPAIRAVARELLAGAVLRPLVMYCTPYYANKGLCRALANVGAGASGGAAALPAGLPPLDAARARALRGHWEFEQRLALSAAAEASGGPAAAGAAGAGAAGAAGGAPPPSGAMPPPPPRPPRRPAHARARSYDFGGDTDFSGGAASAPGSGDGALPPPQERNARPLALDVGAAYSVQSAPPTGRGPAPPPLDGAPTPRSDAASETGSSASETSPLQPRRAPVTASAAAAATAQPWPPADAPARRSATAPSLRPSRLSADASFAGSAAGSAEGAPSSARSSPAPECPAGAPCGAAAAGFTGRPRARVAAADLIAAGLRDVVVYRVRVGDDSGREWTVARRYRHFEVLARQLAKAPGAGPPGGRPRLPPKRIFFHSVTEDFVEERRAALDAYLQAVLAAPPLAGAPDLWEFLRLGSERFEGGEFEGGGNANGGGATARMLAPLGSLGRAAFAAGAGVVDVGGAVVHGVGGAADRLGRAAFGGLGPPPEEPPRAGGRARHRRSVSMQDLDAFGTGGGATPARSRSRARAGGEALARVPAGLLRTATASARKVRRALAPGAAAAERELAACAQRALNFSAGLGAGAPAEASDSEPSRAASLASSPAKRPLGGLLGAKAAAASRAASPTKLPAGARAGGGSATVRVVLPPPAPPPLRLDAAAHGGGAFPTSSAPSSPAGADSPRLASLFGGGPPPALDAAEAAGISAPLYEVVDCLFQLQTRGFFRRQVVAVARQVLALALGDAIDGWLAARLRLLRQEHFLARAIQRLQAALWPGGQWFLAAPAHRAAAAAATAAPAAAGAPPGRTPPLRAEAYLAPPAGWAPADEGAAREAAGELLLRSAPAALVRLVGRGAYAEGAADVYELLQSPALTRQLGYGALEIAALHLCPELKPLFARLEHGGL
jgi:hypothetical protein